MSKPKNAIRDYGYNPNQYSSFESMDSDTTDAAISFQGVLRKHSEFQFPNSETDYEEMDTGYDPFPGSDWLGPFPGAKIKSSMGDSCLRLWELLFPNWKTGARALASNMAKKLDQYAAKCPVTYIWKKCCIKAQIIGASQVNNSAVSYYGTRGIPDDCYATWRADKGRCTGGKYTAPPSGLKDTIYVDTLNVTGCAKKEITLQTTASCATEYIGHTTHQMSLSESQNLTVENAVVGNYYTWVISAGGGSISPFHGTAIVYTAPATNPECASNPTIQLMLGTNICDTLQIAVNNSAISGNQGGSRRCTDYGIAFHNGCPPEKCIAGVKEILFNCGGTEAAESWQCAGGTYCEYDCTNTGVLNRILSFCTGGAMSCVTSTVDYRSAGDKTNGCCPYQLL
jgi:hypothetical protein